MSGGTVGCLGCVGEARGRDFDAGDKSNGEDSRLDPQVQAVKLVKR